MYLYRTLLVVAVLLVGVTPITAITHPLQLAHCLNICHDQVTNCINLKHDKCLKTYHTCLEKAKDFYKCANSSKIKQMKELSKCIEIKCEQIPPENVTELYLKNPFRTMHRELALCRPWNLKGREFFFGKAKAFPEEYRQCKRFVCRYIPRLKGKSVQKDEKVRSKGLSMSREGENEKSSCSALNEAVQQQNDVQMRTLASRVFLQ